MNLYEASRQWAERPADERFWNLDELALAVREHRDRAAVARSEYKNLHVEPVGPEVMLLGANGGQATLSHWAFGQLCARVAAPASYLRSLPPDLVCDNLNYSLKRHTNGDQAVILLDRKSSPYRTRALVTDSYSRIWNYELVKHLQQLPPQWRVPPARPASANQPGSRPATAIDILSNREGGGGLSINIGDLIAPAGLYASFEDMFVFLVSENARLEDGSPDGLSRGFFLVNSEVGKQAFKLLTFYYRHVCGNHIVWNASGLKELRIRHVGQANQRFRQELEIELRKYSDTGVLEEQQKIRTAQQFLLGPAKTNVIDLIFDKGILSRKKAEEAYEIAEKYDEKPETAWGYAQGITRMSQASVYADQRTELDKAAGKVIELAF